MTSANRPQVVAIGGPNGAGKTSAAPELLQGPVWIDSFVNADVIAQGLAAFSPESAAFVAGRIMLQRLHALARARVNFAFESTLAGRSTHRLLTGLAATAYHIHIFYLWLPSPDIAVARVRGRAQAGGHDVPESVVRRRFWKGLVNFDRLYRPIATTWRLYDNSLLGGRPLIAYGGRGLSLVVLDEIKWLEIQKLSGEHA